MEIQLQKNKKMLVLAIMSSMPKIIWMQILLERYAYSEISGTSILI